MPEANELITKNDQDEILEQINSDETLEITIRKGTNEVVIRNPKDNRIVRLRANIEDSLQEQLDDDENEIQPLTPEEFEKALREVDMLGLTFTPELYPSVITKDESSSVVNGEDLERLEEKYPDLPKEVGIVVFNTLTSSTFGLEFIGGSEYFERKSKIIKEILINNSFRDEFFFRHSLKVPYFESIDWEVILKTHERGVEGIVGVPYALLMLTFHNTNPKIGKFDIHQNVTVAVDRYLIDKLLATLSKVRASLDESEKMRDRLNMTGSLKE
jgi:hypothetical protein